MQETAPRTYFNRILFLADFESRSHSALSYARAFAQYYHSHLTLLHAMPDTVAAQAAPLRSYGDVERKRLGLLAAEMVHSGLNVDALVRHGEAADTILLKGIRELTPDLIIQGSAGIDDLRRPIVGSTAETIFRSTGAPVLTVGSHVIPYMGKPLSFEKILFVTDFGSRVKTALIYAISLSGEFRARVQLCHVHEEVTEPWKQQEVKHFFESELQSFISPDALNWCDAECKVSFGKASEQIIGMAERYHPDLIVLGAHSLGPLGTREEPGIAFKVMAHAPCPVLTLLGLKGKPLTADRTTHHTDLTYSC